jgi:hypothetical protein
MQQVMRAAQHLGAGHNAEPGELLVAEEEIGRDIEPRDEVEFLRDHDDAGGMRIPGCREGHRGAGQGHGAAVGLHGAADDAHQRAFAGSVFAEQHVDFPGGQGEIRAAQRAHATVALLHP